jgi:hypothetical protein
MLQIYRVHRLKAPSNQNTLLAMTIPGEPLKRLTYKLKMNIIGGKLGNRVSNGIHRGRDTGICGGQAPGNEKRMEGASQSRQPNDTSRRTLGVRGQDRSDALLLPGKAWAGGH